MLLFGNDDQPVCQNVTVQRISDRCGAPEGSGRAACPRRGSPARQNPRPLHHSCIFFFNIAITSLPIALLPFIGKRWWQSAIIDIFLLLFLYSLLLEKERLRRAFKRAGTQDSFPNLP